MILHPPIHPARRPARCLTCSRRRVLTLPGRTALCRTWDRTRPLSDSEWGWASDTQRGRSLRGSEDRAEIAQFFVDFRWRGNSARHFAADYGPKITAQPVNGSLDGIERHSQACRGAII